jgi:phage terminase large subunit-like protein
MMNSSAAPQTEELERPLPQAPTAPLIPTIDVEGWARRTAKPGDWFDERAAQHAVTFFSRYLRHTKDRWANQPFILEPWQRAIVRTIFGLKRADGTRRFRVVYIEVPRKNGKTALAAGLALYLAFASGLQGAEVYCAASTEEQANICFSEAKRMRSLSTALRERTDAFKKNISANATFSKLQLLTSKSDTKDGLNASGIIGDEFHAWKDKLLYDLLHTSTAARSQPVEIYITTAGLDEDGICADMRKEAIGVLEGTVDNHELLPVIYAADKDDPIDDPATWAKANPNLDISVRRDYLAAQAEKAKRLPRDTNTFKRLHLNIWTAQETLWIPMKEWDPCNLGPVTLETLRGRRCFGGLDLSAVGDLTSLGLTAPREDGGLDIWSHSWLPREGLAERIRNDRVPYDRWADAGLLTLTEGNAVDYDMIRRFITGVLPAGADDAAMKAAADAALINQVELVEIACDRWNSLQIVTQLKADTHEDWIVVFGQGFASMSGPSKALEQMVLRRLINHGGNPLLRWSMGCAAIASDAADNIKPVKPDRRKSPARIDPVVAAIMSIGRAIVAQDVNPQVFDGKAAFAI